MSKKRKNIQQGCCEPECGPSTCGSSTAEAKGKNKPRAKKSQG